MSPSERASSLYEQMSNGGCCNCPFDAKGYAENCVVIVIRELGNINGFDAETADDDDLAVSISERLKYWELVKLEIEKIDPKKQG